MKDGRVLYCPSASKITLGESGIEPEQIGKLDAWCSYEYANGSAWDYNGGDNLNHRGKFKNRLSSGGSVRTTSL